MTQSSAISVELRWRELARAADARCQPPPSKTQVRQILKGASRILRKNSVSNGDADVACDVTFTLKGPVRTFGSANTPPIIMDEQQRDSVHKVDSDVAGVDFHVKVVDEIQFCRRISDRISLDNCCSSPQEFPRSYPMGSRVWTPDWLGTSRFEVRAHDIV